LDVERLTLGCIDEREDGHVSGIPAVNGLVTNLALGVIPLLGRQPSRRHLIFGPAIRTFEDDHCFTVRLRLIMKKARYWVSRQTEFAGKSIIEEGPEHSRSAWVLELSDCLGLDLANPLARYRKLLADFLQRVVAVHAKTKAHAYDALLAWR
jgi:hypothetical protein